MMSRDPPRERAIVRPDSPEYDPSGYRWMWLFAMFDLPMGSKELRREYSRFRRYLLSEGFCKLQFSVYARHCPSEESSDAIRGRVRLRVPEHGQVRLMAVTDRQFGRMEVLYGGKRTPVEEPPQQLMLF